MASRYLHYICGIAICLACHAFTALGIVTQKMVLEACRDKSPYYRQPKWLAGMFIYIVGQLLNVPAAAFVPQTVISALGGLTTVFSLVLARALLAERLSKDQVIAMMVLLVGAALVVVEMPVKEEVLYVDHIFGTENRPFIFTALTVMVLLLVLGVLSAVFESLLLFFSGLTCASCGSYSITFCKCCLQMLSSEGWWHDLKFYGLALGALSVFILQVAITQKMLRYYDAVVAVPVFFGLGILFTILQAQLSFRELGQLQGPQEVVLFVSGVVLVVSSTISLPMLSDRKGEELPLLAKHETRHADGDGRR